MARQYGRTTLSPGSADDAGAWRQYEGRRVGVFQLERLLFVSGQSAFFATTHPTSGGARTARVERVALGSLAYRRSQIEAAAMLAHPAVPSTYLVDTLDDLAVVVMDPFDGRPVTELAEQMPLPTEQAIGIVAAMAGTLDTVHARGFYHGRMWLRRDLSPVLFDFTPAPKADAPPGHGREFHVGRLDWVQGVADPGADRRAVDIVALSMVAWWLLTGRDGPSAMLGRGRMFAAAAASLDRQFLTATEFAEAFATAVRQVDPTDYTHSERPSQVVWQPWRPAPATPPQGGLPGTGTPPQGFSWPGIGTPPGGSAWPGNGTPPGGSPWSGNGAPVTPRPAPMSNAPVFQAPPPISSPTDIRTPPPSFAPRSGNTEAWPRTGTQLAIPALPPSRWQTIVRNRRLALGASVFVGVFVLVAVVGVTIRVMRAPDNPQTAAATPIAVTPGALTAPTQAPAAAAPPAPAPTGPALGAPTPSTAQVAESSVEKVLLEAEALFAPTNPNRDPDRAVQDVDRLRLGLAPTSPSRARIEEVETRMLVEDADKRVADAITLRDRRLLAEAGERYERARTISPSDARVTVGLSRAQTSGWWLDFLTAFAEHDSDRQIAALQRIVQADPEFRTAEGAAKEKLFAALLGKADRAWGAGEHDSARSLLDEAEKMFPAAKDVADRRALWFPTPVPSATAAPTSAAPPTSRPFATPVQPVVVPTTAQAPTQAPATPRPAVAPTQPPPTPRPAPIQPPPTPRPAPTQPPPTATPVPAQPTLATDVYTPPKPPNNPTPRPRR